MENLVLGMTETQFFVALPALDLFTVPSHVAMPLEDWS